MKILMVSMPSLHFFRWTEQLKDAGHEIYWFNVTDSGEAVSRMDWIHQCYGWRLKWDFPGRTRLKSALPKLSKFIEKFNTNPTEKAFEDFLNTVKPDVVHSFALHISCTPIISVMKKYNNLKWIYSSWGSDLYARKIERNTSNLGSILKRVDLLFTDCFRDYEIAKEFGFQGSYLGVFPGGGGYDINFQEHMISDKSNQIVVKGYENQHGKCIFILEKLREIHKIRNYSIVVFGANQKVIDYVKENFDTSYNIKVYRHLKHSELIKLFLASKIYIGYSLSDGTPNTLLEALLSGCIVLQSNPGNVTSEWVIENVNGFLLNKYNIADQIEKALCFRIDDDFLSKFKQLNSKLNRTKVAMDVIKKYESL